MDIIYEFDNCVIVKENGKYGITDIFFNNIYECIFDDIYCNFTNHFELIVNNYKAYINKKTLKVDLKTDGCTVNEFKEFYYVVYHDSHSSSLHEKENFKLVYTKEICPDFFSYITVIKEYEQKILQEKLKQLKEDLNGL